MTRIIRETMDEAIVRLVREINSYESEYGQRTSDMVAQVRAGELPETGDICFWLMANQNLNYFQKQRKQ